MTSQTISLEKLAALVEVGNVKHVTVMESGNGKYGVIAQTPMGKQTLSSQRGDVRLFASIDTAKKFLRSKIGVGRFEVIGQ